jgi:hypothetical protein
MVFNLSDEALRSRMPSHLHMIARTGRNGQDLSEVMRVPEVAGRQEHFSQYLSFREAESPHPERARLD